MRRPAYQDNWRAVEELAIPEFLMNIQLVIKIVVVEKKNALKKKALQKME